ncbi:MAG: energy transducer TonB [Planctomycetota bacterium]
MIRPGYLLTSALVHGGVLAGFVAFGALTLSQPGLRGDDGTLVPIRFAPVETAQEETLAETPRPAFAVPETEIIEAELDIPREQFKTEHPPTTATPVPPEAVTPCLTCGVSLPRGASWRETLESLNNPKPGYPATSRRRGEEGTVVVLVSVERSRAAATLRAVRVAVKQSSGHPLLDREASATLGRWRYPRSMAGLRVEIPVTFRLENTPVLP